MPSTTAASPQPAKKLPDEPDSGGWDASEADTVTNFPDPSELPEQTPRNLPPVKAIAPATSPAASPATQAPGTNVPPTPNSPGTMRGPYPTSPGIGAGEAPMIPKASGSEPKPRPAAQAVTAGLPSAMREEVWAIVRAAVEEAVSPLVAKQRELEARAERAERFAEAAKASAKPLGAGIPQLSATGTIVGVPPPKITAAPPQASIPVTAISLPPDAAVSEAPPAPRVPVASLPPTDAYGVTVMPEARPQLNLDAVGAVDISGFDGGRRKKMVGRAVVFIILAVVVTVVTMTLLSHTG